jgi:hypothetical protein
MRPGFVDTAKIAGQLQGYPQAVYNRYHKPIWLTEYALIDFSSGHELPAAGWLRSFHERRSGADG